MTRKWILTCLLLSFHWAFTACSHPKPRSASAWLSVDQQFAMLISQARNNLNHKEWDLALVDLRAAAVLKPDSATAYNLMGVAFFLKTDYPESVKEFSHAVELNPNYKEAINNLGNAYFMSGDYIKAEAILKKALTFSPPPIASFYSLGTLLAIQGRLTESREYLSMGIELDPEFIESNDNFISHFSSTSFGAPEFNFLFAKAYAASGHIKKTLDFLERAKKSGFTHWDRISTDQDFDEVREDPRIQEYLREEEIDRQGSPFGNG